MHQDLARTVWNYDGLTLLQVLLIHLRLKLFRDVRVKYGEEMFGRCGTSLGSM